MENFHSLEFDVTYLKRLVGAGLDGIAAARHEFEAWGATSYRQDEFVSRAAARVLEKVEW